MSAFRFGLEPVLRQRKLVEQQAQKLVAHRERERIAVEQEIAQLSARDDSERRDLVSKLDAVGRLDAGSLRQQSLATMQIARHIREASLRAAGAAKRLDEARAVLTRATARRRAIELVREQQFLEWKARERRAETNALDEMSMAMRAMKQLGREDAA